MCFSILKHSAGSILNFYCNPNAEIWAFAENEEWAYRALYVMGKTYTGFKIRKTTALSNMDVKYPGKPAYMR